MLDMRYLITAGSSRVFFPHYKLLYKQLHFVIFAQDNTNCL